MGCNIFKKTCWTNPTNKEAIAPNPNPSNWQLIKYINYNNAHVVKVQYHDCTNYEGMKVIVYKGYYNPIKYRDPHFAETVNAPIARFTPTDEGWNNACTFAKQYI